MTRNLNSITGLGHFMLLLAAEGRREEFAARMRALRPAINGGKVPPALTLVGRHGIAAAWGGTVLEKGETATVVGIFQRTRHDCPGVDAPAIERLFMESGNGTVDAGALQGGNFAAVAVHNTEPRALALTSPFRQLPLYRAALDGLTVFATDARLVTALGLLPRDLDTTALYHYLNYSCIPAPCSIFRRLRKVPAGTQVWASPGTVIEEPYWRPRLTGDREAPLDTLEAELRDHIHETVEAYRPTSGVRWGTFLSGGTDSSSITGILSRVPDAPPVNTYSIGFGEAGYDELEFARIAARHYGTSAHYRQVDEQDTLAAIPTLLEAYDEPYGNASAVPTYYCATAAADDGIRVMVAGDGGDESFGGNSRYAKDAVYRSYARLPQGLRSALARIAGAHHRDGHLLANRVRNFVRRGAMSNPARFYQEESFASEHFDELLSPCVRNSVDRDASLDLMRKHYDEAGPEIDELHRLMYIDQMMAIADNDLVKVQRASQAAGVCVTYPYLDTQLVDFTGRLPAAMKVKGTHKRYLFKRALRDLLPAEILSKRKQGFGLPIALWARRPGAFRDLLHDTLRSQRAVERGYFETDFVAGLLDTHDRGSWDMSPELWRLLMLELWQREYVDVT